MNNCFIFKEIVCTRGLSGCIAGRYFFVFDRGLLNLRIIIKKLDFFIMLYLLIILLKPIIIFIIAL